MCKATEAGDAAGVMGRREVEFEVERRQDKTPVEDTEPSKSDDKENENSGGSSTKKKKSDNSWSSWLENPRTMDNLTYFVLAQTFVVLLTYGIPQVTKFWYTIRSLF